MPDKGMRTVGVILAAVLVTIGLAVVGFFIFMALAVNSIGSNK
jgi:hypothetical protein